MRCAPNGASVSGMIASLNRWCLLMSAASALLACGEAVSPLADGGSSDGEPSRCASGSFFFEMPLARTRDRYSYPSIARHRDGFVFATAVRSPAAGCAANACLLVETLTEAGDATPVANVSLSRAEQGVRVFAETDERGEGHYAAMVYERSGASNPQGFSARRVHWGSAPSFAPTEIALDLSRGAMTVAFASDELSVLTHGWRPEATIGEGSDFPVSPRIETFGRAGGASTIRELDSTRGDYFINATLARRDNAFLLTTTHLFTPPGIATDGFATPVFPADAAREYLSCDALLEPSGSTLVGCSSARWFELVRFDRRGVRSSSDRVMRSGDANHASLSGPLSIAQTPDGARSVVAFMVASGVRLVAFDSALRAVSDGVLPMRHTLGRNSHNQPVPYHTVFDLAASPSGMFALVASPFPPSGAGPGGESSPVSITRFRLCR